MKAYPVFAALLLGILLFALPSCQKEISPEPIIQDSTFFASGSLKDSSNNCYAAVVHGTFYNGVTPGSDTAYIEVQVNVINTGSYKIATDIQNGFGFADSGVFVAGGLTTIHLKPVGTPLFAGPADFLVSFDSSFCFVSVEVKDSTGSGAGGTDSLSIDTWQFNQTGTGVFAGDISSATLSGLPADTLLISGTVATGDTTISVRIVFPPAGITPGIYVTSNPGSYFIFGSSSSDTLYYSDATTGVNVMAFVVTSYDSATKIITASFTGTAQDLAGNAVPIANGAIKAVVQ